MILNIDISDDEADGLVDVHLVSSFHWPGGSFVILRPFTKSTPYSICIIILRRSNDKVHPKLLITSNVSLSCGRGLENLNYALKEREILRLFAQKVAGVKLNCYSSKSDDILNIMICIT